MPSRAPTRDHSGITTRAGPTKQTNNRVGPVVGSRRIWSAKYCTPARIVATPADCTTKQSSSARNGRLRPATASCARRLGSLSPTAPCGADRVPRKAPTAPTAISAATNSPIQRCPGTPPPAASRTSGATAPATRMASASTAIRQVIIRVRSA
ncbi:hypothetical protein Jiend_35310 [Micromonospora endophytica]|nr:hypothetical protein Jiend_35310 [Micromonospora endophytica]